MWAGGLREKNRSELTGKRRKQKWKTTVEKFSRNRWLVRSRQDKKLQEAMRPSQMGAAWTRLFNSEGTVSRSRPSLSRSKTLSIGWSSAADCAETRHSFRRTHKLNEYVHQFTHGSGGDVRVQCSRIKKPLRRTLQAERVFFAVEAPSQTHSHYQKAPRDFSLQVVEVAQGWSL